MTPVARPPVALQSPEVLQRRRIVLASLLVAAATTLLLAVAADRSAAWVLQLFVDALLVGYLVVLMRLRNTAAIHEMTLRAERRVPRRSPPAGRISGGQ